MFHHFLKRNVGGRDDPDIHWDGSSVAESFHFAFLQDSQQLWLQLQRHFANLIQQQRSAIGQLKFPGLGTVAPVKAPRT